MAKITNIILHCSASEFGDVDLIRSWHRARGWKDIGYHFVILNGRLGAGVVDKALDGRVATGRPLDGDSNLVGAEVGAHTLGYNARSIGVCLIGNKTFTAAQQDAAVALVLDLMTRYNIPIESVLGHYETDSGKKDGKSCPNVHMGDFRACLRRGWVVS